MLIIQIHLIFRCLHHGCCACAVMGDFKTELIAILLTWWLNMACIMFKFHLTMFTAAALYRWPISNRSYNANFYASKAHFRNLVYNLIGRTIQHVIT